MKKNILFGIALLPLVFACEDKSNPSITEEILSVYDYFPVTKGSYWIYNIYEIDSMGIETMKSENDTLFALGDSLIEGTNYHTFYGNFEGVPNSKDYRFFKDSSNCLVTQKGYLVFSLDNFSDTLYTFIPKWNTNMHMYLIMETVDEQVQLEAGGFNSILNAKLHVDSKDQTNWSFKDNDKLYAKGTGIILKQTYYVHAYETEKRYYEQRLISYYIEE